MNATTAFYIISGVIFATFFFSLIFLIIYLRKHNKEMKAINQKPISVFYKESLTETELNQIRANG